MGIEIIKKMVEKSADMLFPRFCVSCGEEERLLCMDCQKSWKWQGKWFVKEKRYAFHPYGDARMRKLIGAWKYDYDQSAWKILKEGIGQNISVLQRIVEEERIEAVVAIPLHKKRLRERGFDQSKEFGSVISVLIDRPFEDILARNRYTGSQVKRSDQDRRKAMERSPFFVRRGSLSKRILLVDDVWTTGSTAKAAIRELKKRGAEEIFVCTLAYG